MKEGDVMKIKVYHHVQGATFTTWEDAKVLIIFPEGVRIKWGDGTIAMVEANNLILNHDRSRRTLVAGCVR